jgi:ATP/maltotriose-dependent transcriptional regulator MalT/DNA-binding SARP family transcriptional activator
LAKLSAPSLPRIVERPRLFRLLDAAGKRPITWVNAPAGAGKTTLIASYLCARKRTVLWYQLDAGDADPATFFHYLGIAGRQAAPRRRPLPYLTPDFLPTLPTFAQRFFEALFAGLDPPATIVFDNYQDVPESAQFHELMRIALRVVPPHVSLVVLSRAAPPPALSPLQVQRSLATIDEEALSLRLGELKQLAAMQSGAQSKPTRAELQALHARTRGWVAGALLLLESRQAGQRAPARIAASTHLLFDYLATEVLNACDEDVRNVLLKTSVVPSISGAMASSLSGNERAVEILARLHRDRCFTELRTDGQKSYQYHPLFREFLEAEAERRLSASALKTLQLTAAQNLEEAGLVVEAGTLYTKAGLHSEIARLVVMQSPTLLAQGRGATIEGWLKELPTGLFDEAPWLLFWRATCRLPINPASAKRDYTQAFELFERHDERTGMLLAWCGIVDSIWYAWHNLSEIDEWIERFDALIAMDATFPSAEVETTVSCTMFSALFWRRPYREVIAPWAAKVMRSLEGLTEIGTARATTAVALLNYYTQVGELERAAQVLSLMEAALRRGPRAPLAEIGRHHAEAVLAVVLGETARCRRAIDDGLKLAEEHGAYMWNVPLRGAECLMALTTRDVGTAQRAVDFMLAQPPELALVFRSWILTLQSAIALLRGDVGLAENAANASLELAMREGPFPEALARLALLEGLHARGRVAEAEAQLLRVAEIGRNMQSRLIEIAWRLPAARLAFDKGDERLGLEELRLALRAGASSGLIEWQGKQSAPDLARLCAKALEAGIETDYVRALIRLRRLTPELTVVGSDAWPWALKIYTLGRFSIVKDGDAITFTGKTQKRPIALLKALIAFGGRDVTQEKIIAALWPDADGDAAASSLTMALKRLRGLIGYASAVTFGDGKLSLNAAICWVDAWAFERALGRKETHAVELERAVALYHGPFLGADGEAWILSPRERLRDKFLRGVERLGASFEAGNDWAGAVDCYRHGVSIDDLTEEFYRRLMLCHQRLGQRGEAIAAYRRCKKTLAAQLGIEPSARTEQVYRTLRTNLASGTPGEPIR